MEKKDIKDYLHLYLSQQFVVRGGKVGRIVSVGENGSIIVYPDGDQRGNFIINEVLKPVLRTLSSMTIEEGKEIVMLRSPIGSIVTKDKIVINYILDIHISWYFTGVPNITRWVRFDELSPSQFIYLLSKGFDLFNLIPEGLAIDSTLKPV
jgi:hypothetical protein